MKWVKASERLPEDSNLVHIRQYLRDVKFKLTGFYEPVTGYWHRQDGSHLPIIDALEWLDETTPDGWVSEGVKLIAEERQRQVSVEGWTPEHDAEHTDNSIAKAAACYAMPEDERKKYQSFTFSEPKRWYPRWWPSSWSVDWWKPSPNDRIRELVKAGALIAAEIDRLKNDSQTP